MIGWVVGAQAAQHEGGERDDQGRQDAGGMGAAARQECPEGQGRALDEEERCELLRLQEPPRRGQGAQANPQMGRDGRGRARTSEAGRAARSLQGLASDLALYIASEKIPFAAVIRGGKGPRIGEPVIAIGFPLKGLLSSDAIITTGTILRGSKTIDARFKSLLPCNQATAVVR